MEVDPTTVALAASAASLALLSALRSSNSSPNPTPDTSITSGFADSSDTHPLILAEQADISLIRHRGESAIYRSKHAPAGSPLARRPPLFPTTIWAAFQKGREASRKAGSSNYLGVRRPRPESEGGGFESSFSWRSYDDVDEEARALGSGLRSLPHIAPAARIGIYLRTSPEWVIADLAAASAGLVTVPIFDTWSLEMVRQAIQETGLSSIIASSRTLPALLTIAPDCPSLRHIIVCSSRSLLSTERERAARAGDLSLRSLEEVITLGRSVLLVPHEALPGDIAKICYTSGSSGCSKGVLLSHDNILAEAAGLMSVLPHAHQFSPADSFLSYLPMAHVFEQSNWMVMTIVGASCAYYSGDVRSLAEDMSILQPTLFTAVPRVLSRIRDSALAEVAASSPPRRWAYRHAFSAIESVMEREGRLRDHPLGPWAFAPVRRHFGSRLRILFCAASSVDPDLLHFFRVSLAAQVLQGYGQTEAAGATSLALWGDYDREGCVGPPTTAVEIVLRDRPDLGYVNQEGERPRGEIHIRGPSIGREYVTGESILGEGGWRPTGDIGEFAETGALKIIDFARSSVKLSQGFHVAPERVEALYERSPYVHQAFVYADTLQDQMVAIIVPHPPTLLAWARDNGRPDASIEELVQDDRIKELFLDELMVHGCEGNLQGFEHVRLVHLHPHPFSAEPDFLTPTLKPRRRSLYEYFREDIEGLYASLHSRRPART